MTANVEFEALTGFSNAFLPYGSIPYQQYVREPVPSLATFLGRRGIRDARHPSVRRLVLEPRPGLRVVRLRPLPVGRKPAALAKRGPLASDAAFTDEIIRQADATDRPFFYLRRHAAEPRSLRAEPLSRRQDRGEGPISEWARGSLQTYAEGMADADRSLARLIEWASNRERPTVIAFFGDHLPPLGPVYQETGFLEGDRGADAKSRRTRCRRAPRRRWSYGRTVPARSADVGTSVRPSCRCMC